ncbi:MAG: DUF4115 domain-containing protein [Solimonas sp.]
MSHDPSEPTVPAAPQAPTTAGTLPGTLIREARQAAHLSVDDLAAHIKLARTTVEALERDDFDTLLEPVYVRGYYRKCAKVLNLDEKALIAAYAAQVTPKTPQAPAKLRLASGTELGSNSRLPMAMGVLFVVVAIVVCAALWWVRGATTPVPRIVDGSILGAPEPNGTAAAPAPAAPVANAEAVPVPPPAATATAVPSAPVGDAASTGTAATSTAAAPVAAPAPSAAVQSTPVAGSTPSAAATGSGPLLITFNGQSWIRVLDGSGRTLLNGLVGAGERRQLGGKPPFDLFIGAAPAVGVQFEGRAIDLKPYTRDNATARLTLPLSALSP